MNEEYVIPRVEHNTQVQEEDMDDEEEMKKLMAQPASGLAAIFSTTLRHRKVNKTVTGLDQ